MIGRRIAMIIVLLGGSAWAPDTAVAGPGIDAASGVGASRETRALGRLNDDHPVVRELYPDLIKKTIQRYLEGEWALRVKAVQVNVLEPSDPMKVPAGVIELRVNPPASDEGLGRRMFRLSVNMNGRPWKTIEALTDVTAMVDVVVPNRYLKMDELIDAEDLTLSRIRIHELKHPFLTDREDVIGKSAARPLQIDTPIRPTFLKKPYIIKKGDRVMIEARRGGLSIQTSGVTKSSGQVGQSVMVANLDSGRELRATVIAPGLVQVDF